jgi:hypothetical protein
MSLYLYHNFYHAILATAPGPIILVSVTNLNRMFLRSEMEAKIERRRFHKQTGTVRVPYRTAPYC